MERLAFDEILTHQLYIERYEKSAAKKIKNIISELFDRAIYQLLRLDISNDKRRELENFIASLRPFIEEFKIKLSNEELEIVNKFAAVETVAELETAQKTFGVSLNGFTTEKLIAAAKAYSSAGYTLETLFDTLQKKALQTISKEAAIGFLNGETTPQIARRLRDGLELTQRQAEAVTRTSLNHISNQARRLIAEENSDLIKYIKWISTLDFRTSSICRYRDGEVYAVENAPMPPAHINCRSTIVYMRTKYDDADDRFRASKDGLVDAQLTYYEYLKRQKKEVVIDILGQKRAELFLSGKLTGDQLHARDGRLLTLEELADKLKNR